MKTLQKEGYVGLYMTILNSPKCDSIIFGYNTYIESKESLLSTLKGGIN